VSIPPQLELYFALYDATAGCLPACARAQVGGPGKAAYRIEGLALLLFKVGSQRVVRKQEPTDISA
jgi:hypothetical protein